VKESVSRSRKTRFAKKKRKKGRNGTFGWVCGGFGRCGSGGWGWLWGVGLGGGSGGGGGGGEVVGGSCGWLGLGFPRLAAGIAGGLLALSRVCVYVFFEPVGGWFFVLVVIVGASRGGWGWVRVRAPSTFLVLNLQPAAAEPKRGKAILALPEMLKKGRDARGLVRQTG